MGFPDQPSGQGQEGFPGGQPSSGQPWSGDPSGYPQPGYGQPGYGQSLPGYGGYQTGPGGYGPAGYQPRKTNGLAVAALILGIGQVLLGLLAGIPAIILGHVARRQIRQTGESGAGMATAGLVLGYVGVAITIMLVIALVAIAGNS